MSDFYALKNASKINLTTRFVHAVTSCLASRDHHPIGDIGQVTMCLVS